MQPPILINRRGAAWSVIQANPRHPRARSRDTPVSSVRVLCRETFGDRNEGICEQQPNLGARSSRSAPTFKRQEPTQASWDMRPATDAWLSAKWLSCYHSVFWKEFNHVESGLPSVGCFIHPHNEKNSRFGSMSGRVLRSHLLGV